MTIQGKVICIVIVWLTVLAALLALLISFRKANRSKLLLRVIAAIFAAMLVVFLMPYLSSRDIEVDLELCYVLTDVTDEKNRKLDSLEWYAIYEEYGLGVDSRFNQQTISWVEWPELDLERYTYIVSFGREMTSLSYNVWESRQPAILDLGTSFKIGIAEFGEEIDTSLVYIYRIPKMRIDHRV